MAVEGQQHPAQNFSVLVDPGILGFRGERILSLLVRHILDPQQKYAAAHTPGDGGPGRALSSSGRQFAFR